MPKDILKIILLIIFVIFAINIFTKILFYTFAIIFKLIFVALLTFI